MDLMHHTTSTFIPSIHWITFAAQQGQIIQQIERA